MKSLSMAPVNQLHLQNERLALEMIDIGSMFSAIGAKIRNALATIIPSLRSSKAVLEDDAGHTLTDLPLSRADNAFIRKVNMQPYYMLQDAVVYVPQGLNVSYAQYLDKVELASQRSLTLIRSVLMPYKEYLSHCVSNPSALLTTDDRGREYIALDSSREHINKELGACFSKNEHGATLPFHKAIGAPADLARIYQRAALLTQQINSVSRDELKNLTDQCADLLESIYANLKSHPDQAIAKEAAQRIAAGAYQVARELEFYSITYFRVLTINGSMDNTRKHFDENM